MRSQRAAAFAGRLEATVFARAGFDGDRSRAALRSVSLMRRCQPGPAARKWSMTSGSRRSDTSFLSNCALSSLP